MIPINTTFMNHQIMSVQSRSDGVNRSLHIEKLCCTRNLLRKVQAYGDSSFQDCKRASEEAVTIIIKNLQDFCQLLADDLGLLIKLRDLIVDWVQEGFQDFFRALDDHFLLLSGGNNLASQDQVLTEGTQIDKVITGLVLVLAQLCAFIEQNAIPIITEEIAVSFSVGGVRDYENGPAFVPGEICRIFRSAGEKFLHHYINMRTQRISVLLRKRFTTPNWVKLEAIGTEVKLILPQGVLRKHYRSDSNGSTISSCSNPLRDSNTQRARSQLLETQLAKLLKQKVEIFTQFEYIQVIVAASERCLDTILLGPPVLDKLI